MRTVEGEPGDLRVSSLLVDSPKSVESSTFEFLLSLHRRVHELTADTTRKTEEHLDARRHVYVAKRARLVKRSCLPECPPRTQRRSSSPRPTLAKEEVKNDKASAQEEIPKDSLRYPRDDDDGIRRDPEGGPALLPGRRPRGGAVVETKENEPK